LDTGRQGSAERGVEAFKLCDRLVAVLSLQSDARTNPLHVLDGGWKRIKRQVIQSLIKECVFGDLNPLGIHIIP
jgi:hypothetical protein